MPPPEALLVTTPAVNFRDFLVASQKLLGHSPASAADASRRELSEPEKFLSCLAAFRDQNARVGPAPNPTFLSHLSFGVFVVAEERDMREVLECCSGMSFVIADTLGTRVLAAIITGTLAQWRDAVVAGLVREAEASVRVGFHRIHNLFYNMNLNVWSDHDIREAADGTFFMEPRRQR
jgi:hypothetical protein